MRGKLANDSALEALMIDLDTIEDADECDGECMHVFGRDTETDEWRWAWIPVEDLIEAGRGDLTHWLFDAA